jgi:hypothetical protein
MRISDNQVQSTGREAFSSLFAVGALSPQIETRSDNQFIVGDFSS